MVSVHALEGVDPSRLRRSTGRFEEEDRGARLARREKNWIARVRFGGVPADDRRT